MILGKEGGLFFPNVRHVIEDGKEVQNIHFP